MALPILVAMVAGLFSILGSFAGAFLARRTYYEQWLRQGRSEVFATFISKLTEARTKATEAIYDNSIPEQKRNIRVTELYTPVLDYAKIVRLYLPAGKRDVFEQTAKEYWSIHASTASGQQRYTTMDAKLGIILAMFEELL